MPLYTRAYAFAFMCHTFHSCIPRTLARSHALLPEACRFDGTPRGCRRGRRCRDLHIAPDGSVVPTSGPPDSGARLRDSWRCRLHAALRAHLDAAGSQTELAGSAYTRDAGEPRVRFSLDAVRQPSQRAWEVTSRGGLELPDGSWLTPMGAIAAGETAYHAGLVVFYHGTTVERGLQTLEAGHVQARVVPHRPVVGSCLHVAGLQDL